jgi:hypothetical protein
VPLRRFSWGPSIGGPTVRRRSFCAPDKCLIDTDAFARVVGYAVSPAAGLTAVGERKQKRSNAIVLRVHSAIVKRSDARSDATARAETF